MIYKNYKELTELHLGSRTIAAVYKGTRLLWEAVRSCFGKGVWIKGKPWVNSDNWRRK